MYLGVIDVKPLDNYQLELVFENKEVRLFDIKPYLDTGVFSELQDRLVFKTVHVSPVFRFRLSKFIFDLSTTRL